MRARLVFKKIKQDSESFQGKYSTNQSEMTRLRLDHVLFAEHKYFYQMKLLDVIWFNVIF